MNIEEVRDYCLGKAFATEDMPFGDDYVTFRIAGKIFCGIALSQGQVVQMKCAPEEFDEVTARYPFVTQAWHWHKRHWIEINLSEPVAEDVVRKLIDRAYDVVFNKLPRKVKEGLSCQSSLADTEKGRMERLAEELLAKEDAEIRHLYAALPYQGTEEEKEACMRLLYRHSRDVADLALEIAARHPEMNLDTVFIERAALLHDVGVVWTDAPGIHCHGSERYIRHGELGSKFLAANGLAECGNVASRHTGAGISDEDIAEQNLPLSFGCLPLSLEEKIICYADKFYSKSHPERRKTLPEARRSLEKFGGGTKERFDALIQLFGEI